MSQENLESVLAAARKLPPDEQHHLAEQLLKAKWAEIGIEDLISEMFLRLSKEELDILRSGQMLPFSRLRGLMVTILREHNREKALLTQRALEAVEKTRGSMKGLDRDTIIWLAEDEELCGY